jgi:hypothetical protein
LSDLDRITKELAEVDEAIWRLPDDAFAERYELLKKRDALRKEAGRLPHDWDERRPTEELAKELEAQQHHLDAIVDQQIDLVSDDDGGGGEGTSTFGLNQKIADANDAAAIRERIGRIKGILSDRGATSGTGGSD